VTDRAFYCPRCGSHRGHGGTCDRDGTLLAAADATALLGMVVGNYVIVQRLGEGGMGAVYRAIQPTIGAEVAIKVLHAPPGAEAAMTQRFLLEARAVNRVRHPNLIRIVDTGVLAGGRPYLVMELLEGIALAKAVGALTPALACHVACEVLGALEAVHEDGIVHRDLKPANIFLARDGRVVVLDFGIAKLVSAAGTPPTTGLFGTPEYMAPEQIRSEPIDRRTDIYAMGVTLYELVTGRRPFAAATTFDLLTQHLEVAPRSARELAPTITAALDDAITTAIAKDPAQRFARAKDFAAAIRAAAPLATRSELAAFVAGHAPTTPPPIPLVAEAADATTTPTVAGTLVESRREVRPPKTTVDEQARGRTPRAEAAPKRTSRTRRFAIAGAIAAIGAGAAIVAFDHDGASTHSASPDAFVAASARDAAAAGGLEVKSDPSGAQLVIDHVDHGLTPQLVELSPGAHVVHVERAGYRGVDEAAEVVAGERASLLVTLPAIATPAPIPTRPTAPRPSSASQPPTSRPGDTVRSTAAPTSAGSADPRRRPNPYGRGSGS
jgi:hypothetical protein